MEHKLYIYVLFLSILPFSNCPFKCQHFVSRFHVVNSLHYTGSVGATPPKRQGRSKDISLVSRLSATLAGEKFPTFIILSSFSVDLAAHKSEDDTWQEVSVPDKLLDWTI